MSAFFCNEIRRRHKNEAWKVEQDNLIFFTSSLKFQVSKYTADSEFLCLSDQTKPVIFSVELSLENSTTMLNGNVLKVTCTRLLVVALNSLS